MKVALVYTSTTPELIELVEKEVGDVLPRTRRKPLWRQRSWRAQAAVCVP